jgi:hypothetical protein
MKLKAVLFSATALLAMHAGTAHADAKNGFSINGGLASHSMSATMIPSGTPYSYTSSGLSLGLDYQFALSPEFSLSPFLMSSGESTSGALVSGTTAGHGILGLQLRYWAGDVFVGGHLARYSEVLSNPNIASVSANGNGWGLVAGWEQPDGGLYVMGQLDWAKVQYVDANVNLTGFRASVGYRWK